MYIHTRHLGYTIRFAALFFFSVECTEINQIKHTRLLSIPLKYLVVLFSQRNLQRRSINPISCSNKQQLSLIYIYKSILFYIVSQPAVVTLKCSYVMYLKQLSNLHQTQYPLASHTRRVYSYSLFIPKTVSNNYLSRLMVNNL